MSGSIGNIGGGGFGIIQQLISNSAAIRSNVNTLTEQASSGFVSRDYAGLGDGAAVALNLNPQLNDLKTWQTNISQATGTMTVTQAAMKQMQSIASTFLASTNNLNGLNASELDSVAANARSALQEVAGLLDTQNGTTYVFSGVDSTNPPVPTPDSILTSGFYTQINAAVAALATNGATATIASTLTTASSNAPGISPFSTYLSQPAALLSSPVVQIGDGRTMPYGMLASANSVAVSAGSSTTHSYMRDLMRSLATLGSLSSTQVNDTGLLALVQDTRTSLNGAITAMATDVGVMGDRQTSLTNMQSQLSDTATALLGQLSSVQEVDMAKTLSALTQINTQLQASYQVLVAESGLSLVKFLPAG
jgi:flagellar hook-associated protein 3 FlgL